MPREGASRSPRRSGAEASKWISRQLVLFGRYPNKRPKGLRVDSDGSMRLSDIMRDWGWSQGLEEQQIMDSVRDNMIHEDDAGSLRFAVRTDDLGGVIIRVLPKRGLATPTRSSQPHCGDGATYVGEGGPAAPASQRSTADKLGLSLDELIREERVYSAPTAPAPRAAPHLKPKTPQPQPMAMAAAAARPAPAPKRNAAAAAQPARGSVGQLLPTARGSVAAIAGPPDSVPVILKKRSGAATWRTTGEHIQRWISWVLQAGHQQLHLELVHGTAVRVDDLAAVMGRERPQFQVSEGATLRAILEETDLQGRFEIDDDGLIRKVPRGARRGQHGHGGGAHAAAPVVRLVAANGGAARGAAAGTVQRPAPGLGARPAAVRVSSSSSGASTPRHQRRSRSRSQGSERQGSDDEHLAAICGQSLQVCEGRAPGEAPPPPPGDHWVEYIDQELAWWFYDGPLGKWYWKDGEAPQPYNEEEDA